jgi:tetratricopeptide (TPR) repeat protein
MASSKFDLSSFRQFINCDACGKQNPSKRCSQCRCTYYCSVECQKEDWTKNHHKEICNERHRAMLKWKEQKNMVEEEMEHGEALDASCAICLEEPIVNAVVLKGCGHAFCSTCLMEWQKYQQNAVMPSFSESCSCPMCRQTLPKTVAEEALEKAKLYVAAGHLVDVPYNEADDPIILKVSGNTLRSSGASVRKEFPQFQDERQRRLYQLALDQLDQILLHDPYDLPALFFKGEAFRNVHPDEAIKSFEMALDVDSKASENRQKMEAFVKQMPDPYNLTEEEKARYGEAYNALTQSNDFHVNIMGSGPCRLFPAKVMLAESYESAGQFDKAGSIYNELLHYVAEMTVNPRQNVKISTSLKIAISAGASRCFYLEEFYHRAIFFCNMILELDRHFPGNHLVLAQSQWALGHKQAALTTLKRGILYEAPDSVPNRQRNITCLERLSSMYSE